MTQDEIDAIRRLIWILEDEGRPLERFRHYLDTLRRLRDEKNKHILTASKIRECRHAITGAEHEKAETLRKLQEMLRQAQEGETPGDGQGGAEQNGQAGDTPPDGTGNGDDGQGGSQENGEDTSGKSGNGTASEQREEHNNTTPTNQDELNAAFKEYENTLNVIRNDAEGHNIKFALTSFLDAQKKVMKLLQNSIRANPAGLHQDWFQKNARHYLHRTFSFLKNLYRIWLQSTKRTTLTPESIEALEEFYKEEKRIFEDDFPKVFWQMGLQYEMRSILEGIADSLKALPKGMHDQDTKDLIDGMNTAIDQIAKTTRKMQNQERRKLLDKDHLSLWKDFSQKSTECLDTLKHMLKQQNLYSPTIEETSENIYNTIKIYYSLLYHISLIHQDSNEVFETETHIPFIYQTINQLKTEWQEISRLYADFCTRFRLRFPDDFQRYSGGVSTLVDHFKLFRQINTDNSIESQQEDSKKTKKTAKKKSQKKAKKTASKVEHSAEKKMKELYNDLTEIKKDYTLLNNTKVLQKLEQTWQNEVTQLLSQTNINQIKQRIPNIITPLEELQKFVEQALKRLSLLPKHLSNEERDQKLQKLIEALEDDLNQEQKEKVEQHVQATNGISMNTQAQGLQKQMESYGIQLQEILSDLLENDKKIELNDENITKLIDQVRRMQSRTIGIIAFINILKEIQKNPTEYWRRYCAENNVHANPTSTNILLHLRSLFERLRQQIAYLYTLKQCLAISSRQLTKKYNQITAILKDAKIIEDIEDQT